MKKAYIYPLSSRHAALGLYNPYIDDFIHSCNKYIVFVNYDKPSRIGIFDTFKYLFQLDYIFFNWIEKLPENKGGKIQTIILTLLLPILKLLKVKVIWTMHNKLSHSLEHEYWKRLIFRKMLKYADIILTHSNAGVRYGEEMLKGSGEKIIYIPHPVKDRRLTKHPEKEYDILIWGTISPYKGIDKFLEKIHQNNLQSKYRILIVGKITKGGYLKKLEKYISPNIRIEDKFIEDELLQELIAKSNIILFTYSQSSILSSGVLMDSLGYGANILGPEVGAFADLAIDGIIHTYTDFSDMIKIIDEQLNDELKKTLSEKSNKFLEDNSWQKFAENLSRLIN